MLQLDVAAKVRQNFGKEAMRSLRHQGRTPAILYGPKTDPLALSVETKDFTHSLLFLHGQNAVFALEVEGGGESKEKRHVLLKEVQTDPVKDTVLHADFYEISMDEELTLHVPLKFNGKPKGVDMGGILNIVLHGALVKGRPLDIPDELDVDISGLELNGPGITCGEIVLPANVTLVEDVGKVCASVIHPSRAVDASAAEGETPAGAGEAAGEKESSGKSES
jgi:large subunit ribosomal protein L25